MAMLLATTASAQIPNGGFESWVDHGTYMDPVGWLTYNDIITTGGPVITVERSSPGAVGNYYATVTSQPLFDQSSVIQGWLSVGVGGHSGFYFTSRPAMLTGQWQYGIQPNDTAEVQVLLTKWDGNAGMSYPIAHGVLEAIGTLSGWHAFTVTLNYFSSLTPDSAHIQFSASKDVASPVAGSFLKVDDLAFAGTVGVEEQPALPEVGLFPSPATTSLHIVADRRVAEVDVLDVTGRTVLKKSANAESTIVDITDLNPGRYLVQLRMADGKPVVRSFVKQ